VINRDGSHLERILNPNPRCGDVYPAWSPDSLEIAFTRDCHDGGIFVVSLSDGQLRRLTSNPQDNEPAWSPDGSQIAFSRKGNRILIVDVAGGAAVRLPGATDAYSPSWSPDGSQIVFGSDRGNRQDIWVMNSDGSNQRPLTSDRAVDFAPAWKP
jgi:TolB protein